MSSQRGARSPDAGRPRVSVAPVVRTVSIRRMVLVTGLAALLFSSALAPFFFGGGALGRPLGAPPTISARPVPSRRRVRTAVRRNGPREPSEITGFYFAPTIVSLGNGTTITVNATSPGGPLTYAYGGLPPGCESTNASRLACRPTAAGAFDVTMSVRDVAGDLASDSGNLTVRALGTGALGISGYGSSTGKCQCRRVRRAVGRRQRRTGLLTYGRPRCRPAAPRRTPRPSPRSECPGKLRPLRRGQRRRGRQPGRGRRAVSPSVTKDRRQRFVATPGTSPRELDDVLAEAGVILPFLRLHRFATGVRSGYLRPERSRRTRGRSTSRQAVDDHGRGAANTTFTDLVSTGGPKGPTNPVASSGPSSSPGLLWALVGVAAGAAVSLALLELALGRRRLRRDGLAIVLELTRSPMRSETVRSELDEP